ncbi:MAG: roadblock/LC7 domain-containing protein [Candidatus Electryoneaceae bacterium]|nr:roadblock/LC7 domain-containing protein [Candidatus Electryoneaceae bacterium]
MAELTSLLEELADANGVKSVMIVSRDGFVIDSVTNEDIDAEAIGAVVSTGVGSAKMIGDELQVGDLNQTMLEYENGVVWMSVVGDEVVLAITVDIDANIGNIRYKLKKLSPEISNCL